MRRDEDDTAYHRRLSLYKPSTYCLYVIFPVAQENQAPGPRKSRLRGASYRLTCDSPIRSPSLFRPSQCVSWSGRPHLEPVSASLHFFSVSLAPVARRSQRSCLWESAHRLFKKRPTLFQGWFLNRFTSSHETNQLIYLVKQSLIES